MSSEERQDRLIGAVLKMSELPDSEKVDIRGKRYAEVHTRVQAFREAYGENGRIISTIHVVDETKVLAETTVSVFVGESWRVIANDFAEEFRGSGPVNKTSCVENCLTSSIGRSLSACGLSGGSYASFDEVNHAINEKAEAPAPKPKKAVAKPKPKAKPKASERSPKPTPEQYLTSASINGKEWPLEERMEEQKKQVSEVSEETIKNVMYFIFQTIFYFSLPPEGTPEKEGDPETVAGWIGRFTSRSDNNKALLDLHKAGYKEEISQLNKELDKLRSLSIEQLRDLIKEQQEK